MPLAENVPVASSKTLVVISYWDQRPVADLNGLIRSMERHEAGRSFDACIVVNQESGRALDAPKTTFPLSVLNRPNAGMNIGAWDWGWREMPLYDHYIFLQDECRILRDGWLDAYVRCLLEPEVGIVGESINQRWCRSWDELVAEPPKNPRSNLVLERARICLRFMRSLNIPAGLTARHLRSLIWGLSKSTLQKLSGFPIGANYEECIAAEVAVSRQVESLGLSIRQIHRLPFYYVSHVQWINTYPALSASLTYGAWVRKQFADQTSPFLENTGTNDKRQAVDRLVKRLETERGLFEENVVRPRSGILALLAVCIDRSVADRDLVQTALSWCLQSAPQLDLVFVAADQFQLARTRDWMAKAEYDDFSRVRVCLRSEWPGGDLDSYRFILFARPGDLFHPSLASALALLDESESPDIVVWNERRSRRADSGAWLLHQPRFEPMTIQSVGHVGMAFAVRPMHIQNFPFDFVTDLLDNNSHVFHLWLSQVPGLNWITHPEFFSFRLVVDQDPSLAPQPGYEAYKSQYRNLIAEGHEFEIFPARNGHRAHPVFPVRRANSMSVVVSFRDRPQETLACLKSLVGQKLSGTLEIVLINNRSSEKSLAVLRGAVDGYRADGVDIKLVDYDAPFNHSRQTNLGVRISTGEVLVFLNNDAELTAPGILEEMGAWALLPGVGTVGCQHLGEKDQLLSAGIRVRAAVPSLQSSLVEESREVAYSGKVRELGANTFAFAVIARSKFEQVGWLNETEFPNGYNDVEYCLRLCRAGYRSIYLGHLRIKHSPGTSRGHCDESFQKILLRRRYPELLIEGMFQLGCEWRADRPAEPPSRPPVPESPPGMKKASSLMYNAILYWVQRRILRGRGL